MKFEDVVICVASLTLGMTVGSWVSNTQVERKVANGELACEYHHNERVCWNPKEQ